MLPISTPIGLFSPQRPPAPPGKTNGNPPKGQGGQISLGDARARCPQETDIHDNLIHLDGIISLTGMTVSPQLALNMMA
jgi:hypothetical protein